MSSVRGQTRDLDDEELENMNLHQPNKTAAVNLDLSYLCKADSPQAYCFPDSPWV